MILQGKGFFTFNLSDCEAGEPDSILAAAQAAGLSHVIVKIADGERAFGLDASGTDFTAPVVQALHSGGIAVWGWHYVYGNNPLTEASAAISRLQALGLDGYVVDAENEYQSPGMDTAARQFMNAVRSALSIPIALSSFRFPNYHSELPWSTFLEFCDLHMPQITWEQAHNPGAQLRESKRQCDALPNARPYIPAGVAYGTSGWAPTADETDDFLNSAKALGLPAVNFFYWDYCQNNLPEVWKQITEFVWPAPAPSPVVDSASVPSRDTFLARFLATLNGRQPDQASALYHPAAIQVRADRILQGADAIQTGYAAFFNSLPIGTKFSISRTQLEDDLRKISWNVGQVKGETTLVTENDKIILEYTFIS